MLYSGLVPFKLVWLQFITGGLLNQSSKVGRLGNTGSRAVCAGHNHLLGFHVELHFFYPSPLLLYPELTISSTKVECLHSSISLDYNIFFLSSSTSFFFYLCYFLKSFYPLCDPCSCLLSQRCHWMPCEHLHHWLALIFITPRLLQMLWVNTTHFLSGFKLLIYHFSLQTFCASLFQVSSFYP